MKKIENFKVFYLIFLVLMLVIIGRKTNLHVDEIFSYGLANQQGTIQIQIENGVKYSPASAVFMDYMTVNSNNKFDYVNVWDNQKKDVHPPLYYVILHTICSFFPEVYSVWFAGVINIIFALLTLFMLRKIVRLMCDDNNILNIVSISFIFSAGVLSAVSFLRMYILAMFIVTWITFLVIDSVQEFERRKLLQIFVVSILGALTHYYCIVYVFFLSLLLGIHFICKKKWKDLITFISIMVCAGLSAISIFPAMLNHVFSGYRGTESIDNLSNHSWSEYWERLKSFFTLIDKQIFGEMIGIIIVLCVFIELFVFVVNTEERGIFENYKIKKDNSLIKWILLVVPSILYFLLVSKSAVYVADRYLFPIYAICLISIVLVIYKVSKGVIKKDKLYLFLIFCCAIITANSWRGTSWNYLYTSSQQLTDKAKEYASLDCLFVYDTSWKVQPSFYEVRNYNSVTFVPPNNLDIIKNLDCISQTELIVSIIGDSENIVKKIMEVCPMLTKYEKLGNLHYATTYRLYGESSSKQMELYANGKQMRLGTEELEDGSKNVCLQEDNSVVNCVYSKDSEFCTIWMGNKVVDITKSSYEIGTNIQLFAYNGTNAQKWRFQENADGSYTIISMHDYFVLAYDEKGNVYLDKNTGAKNTKWWIIE